jgi:hypothetical protein
MPSRPPKKTAKKQPQPKLSKAQTQTAAVMGGATVTVSKWDGTTQEVFVRSLYLRQLIEFAECAEDDLAVIQLTTQLAVGKGDEPGTLDLLTDESIAQLAEVAKELNFERAVSWMKRRILTAEETAAAIGPVVRDLGAIFRKFAALSASPSGSSPQK